MFILNIFIILNLISIVRFFLLLYMLNKNLLLYYFVFLEEKKVMIDIFVMVM